MLLLLDGMVINDGIVDLPESKEPEDPVETQFDLYEGAVETQDMDSAEDLATVAASVSVEAFVEKHLICWIILDFVLWFL